MKHKTRLLTLLILSFAIFVFWPMSLSAQTMRVSKVKDGLSFVNRPIEKDSLAYFYGYTYDPASYEFNYLGLWRSDGTEQGTYQVSPALTSAYISNLINVNGTLFFSANTSDYGYELWKSDGTENGTTLVKDIYPGSSSSSPNNLVSLNGILYFTANHPSSGTELWMSDGTSAGTVLVKDINPGSGSSNPAELTNVNGVLFFSASEPTYGQELWKSDGSGAGTVLVKNINYQYYNSNPYGLTNLNGTLYFAAWDYRYGYELWKSNGTDSGTVQVKDIYPGTYTYTDRRGYTSTYANSSSPYSLTNVNGMSFFQAKDGTNGMELWKSDGTSSGTVLVKDIYPGGGGSYPYPLTDFNGTLFFSANDPTYGTELWKSDGTSAGTILVKDINPGSSSSSPNSFTVMGTNLIFVATNPAYGTELWKSDGTPGGTDLVKDIIAGGASSKPGNLANINGSIYFRTFSPTSAIWIARFVPYPPNVISAESTAHDTTPTWSWTAGGGGNGTFRYKLNDPDLGTGATLTSQTSYTPPSRLAPGTYTLYVEEQNTEGHWSDSGSYTVTVVNVAATLQSAVVSSQGDLAASTGLTAADPNDDPLTFHVYEGPHSGTVIIEGSVATYYPDYSSSGTVTYSVVANDGYADSNIATITVTIPPSEPLPVALALATGQPLLFFPRRIEADEFSLFGQSSVVSNAELSAGKGILLNNGDTIEYRVPFEAGQFLVRVRHKSTLNTGGSELAVYINGVEKDRISLAGDVDNLYVNSTGAIPLNTNDILQLQLAGASGNDAIIDFAEFFPVEASTPAITITQNNGTTVTMTDVIDLVIPAGVFAEWDPSVTSVSLSGSAAHKVSANVGYALDNKAVVIDALEDLVAGDAVTITGLRYKARDVPSSGPGRLKLALNNNWQQTAASDKILMNPVASVRMGGKFLPAGLSTEISPIMVSDTVPPQIQKTERLKLVIPASMPTVWDTSITTVTLAGTAKDRVSPQVTYSGDAREMILQVTENFYFGDTLQITGAKAIATQDCLLNKLRVMNDRAYVITEQN